jgi:peroxiredoxin
MAAGPKSNSAMAGEATTSLKAQLDAFRGDSWRRVSFYRGGWCRYCNLELRAFQKALSGITKLSAQLVAISP